MVGHRSNELSAQGRVARAVLEPDALCMVFQPVVACATGECCAFEALARFPQLRMSPERVFAAAHAHGVGHQLEMLAIGEALRAPNRPPGAALCVNVSPSLLHSGDLRPAIPSDLHGVVFEITEHELCPNDHRLSAVLGGLRERGAQIAVDDVGTGYAGLHSLVKVRPEIIKVDRVLIAGIHRDSTRLALIASLVSFADQTGAELWAEGVEDLADLEALVGLGTHAVQGFLLARPGAPWVAPISLVDLIGDSRDSLDASAPSEPRSHGRPSLRCEHHQGECS